MLGLVKNIIFWVTYWIILGIVLIIGIGSIINFLESYFEGVIHSWT